MAILTLCRWLSLLICFILLESGGQTLCVSRVKIYTCLSLVYAYLLSLWEVVKIYDEKLGEFFKFI